MTSNAVMEKGMTETPEILKEEDFDELTLLSDSVIVSALVANLGYISRTAKALRCRPADLYKRVNLNPSLRKQATDELDSRCGLLVDRSMELLELGLRRGDRGSEKLAVRILERTGMLQQFAERALLFFSKKPPSASTEPLTGNEALDNWQKKLSEAARDENGNIIVGNNEEDQKH